MFQAEKSADDICSLMGSNNKRHIVWGFFEGEKNRVELVLI